MTQKDVDKAIIYMEFFDEIKTFTRSKRKLLELAMKHIKTGEWDIVKSRPQYFYVTTVGDYYRQRISNRRRGVLYKYRGKEVFVMCIKSGKHTDRHYIVSPIEPEPKEHTIEGLVLDCGVIAD